VKQKENIFEELDRMRNLIHTRPGVVISEQANAGADVGAIMRELDKTNSDESSIVNIVKKYKDKASFKNFTDQYKTISGKDFGTDVFRAIQPYNDKTEWADLSNHLKSMGITLGTATTNRGNSSMATLTGLDTPAAANTDDAWKTTYSCVTTQPGAKAVKTNNAGTAYLVGQIYYYANGRKKLADGTMASYSCSTEFKSRTANSGSRGNTGARANVISDYSKQIQTSLGSSPTGKISSQDLDLILKTLNGGEVSGEVPQSLPMDANGKPDLDKILASL
jgi:hypothetical protein